jgi:hypothetical protein
MFERLTFLTEDIPTGRQYPRNGGVDFRLQRAMRSIG